MTSRRIFMSALPAAWSGFAAALQAAPAGAAGDEAFWKMVRQQFPLRPDLAYLNAANVCPSSRLVLDRYLDLLRDFHMDPSFQNRDKFKPMYEDVRGKLAHMLGADIDEIAMTRNTSEGSNLIVEGLDLKAGDEVVITAHNHPSNLDSWKLRARRLGLEIKVVPVKIPAASREDLISGFERALTPKTKVVAFTHLTSTTGVLYPAKEITELAHRRGAWVHLDGAQSFGALQVNLHQIGCDSYSGSAHKWMMGPLEAGVLYVRAGGIGKVWPSIVTAGWSEDLKGARKFENLGQRDDARIAALASAVDFYSMVGAARVEQRGRDLAAELKKQLAALPNVRLKTNLEPDLSAGIVKFQFTNKGTKESYDRLWSRHKLALAITASGDAEGIRVSPHIYNSPEDIARAVEGIREIATA